MMKRQRDVENVVNKYLAALIKRDVAEMDRAGEAWENLGEMK